MRNVVTMGFAACWSASHPSYAGGGATRETFTGTLTQRAHLHGSVEVGERSPGIRGTLGVLPQRFTQDAPARDDHLTLVLAGLGAVLYPAAGSGGDLQPYVQAGAGGQKATGDMGNGGFYLTGAAGLRLRLDARLALEGGVQILRLK